MAGLVEVIDGLLGADGDAARIRDGKVAGQRASGGEVRRGEAYSNFSKEALDRTVPPTPNLSGPGPKSVSSLLEYPEDWPAISEMRLRDRASGFVESKANRQAMTSLQKAVSVNFNSNQLDQVFSYMNQVSGVEFYPDWKALEGM